MLCADVNSTFWTISVGARASRLSCLQVQEVLEEIQAFYPHIQFAAEYMATTGDKDQQTSLRDLERTNFFTKEIDELVLSGQCRLGIHSAKDLPHPLPPGLELICLTKGMDASDSLVLRPDDSLKRLPSGARIATSALRREEMVKQLRADLTFCDIRGTIEQRLAKLNRKEVDGVVIAEAALIRLGLTHLNRIHLPGATVAGQGQLAVIAKTNDKEMTALFTCMDSRQQTTPLFHTAQSL